jgi:hypothetical protein
MQLGYVTPDMDNAIEYWANLIGAGPFYWADFEPEQQTHRGKPTHIRFRVAYAFSGDVHIELVQQLSGGASAYAEALERRSSIPASGIFHHLMLKHDGYDRTYNDILKAGAEKSYDAFVPGVGRFCYLDARSYADSYLELVEDTTEFEKALAKIREIHLTWDGRKPKREFGELF